MFADKRAEDAIIMASTLSSPAVPLDWHASDDAASHMARCKSVAISCRTMRELGNPPSWDGQA